MAFKLTKEQRKQLDHFQSALAAERRRIQEKFDDLMESIRADIRTANARSADYNALVKQAQAFVTEIAEDHRDAYDEKSERWQEGDAGQAALAFVEAWENVDLDEIEPIQILMPDPPSFGEAALKDLPEEAE